MLRIFTYLDKLFHIVKPQKLIFMAIDGEALFCWQLTAKSSIYLYVLYCCSSWPSTVRLCEQPGSLSVCVFSEQLVSRQSICLFSTSQPVLHGRRR